MTIQLIIEFVFVLGALIFVHEFGHLIACKLLHIEVEEFGFGYPPRALKLFELVPPDPGESPPHSSMNDPL